MPGLVAGLPQQHPFSSTLSHSLHSERLSSPIIRDCAHAKTTRIGRDETVLCPLKVCMYLCATVNVCVRVCVCECASL